MLLPSLLLSLVEHKRGGAEAYEPDIKLFVHRATAITAILQMCNMLQCYSLKKEKRYDIKLILFYSNLCPKSLPIYYIYRPPLYLSVSTQWKEKSSVHGGRYNITMIS